MRVGQTGNNAVNSAESSESRQANRTTRAGLKNAKRGEKAAASGGVNYSDSVKADISTKGKEFAQAKAIASRAPDVREKKIAELKKRIEENKYNVDAKAVADRMVDEHLEMYGIG
ncbi:MAG: flagellar biosynthesis anti-sigma factor FlgM [Candidatus Poribacteria bacterium]